MKPLKRLSLADAAVASMKEYIIENDLHAGDRLPAEREFCEQLEVSRRVVREAFTALESVGIINVRAGDGAYVSEFDYGKLIDHCVFTLKRSGQAISDLAAARCAIELGTIETVISRIDDSDAALLEEIADDIRNAGSIAEHLEADCHFHKTLIELSGNEPLIEFCRLIDAFFYKLTAEGFRHMENHWLIVAEQHRLIAETVKRRDIDTLRRLIREHYTPYRNDAFRKHNADKSDVV